jgi:hypothetical protein
MDKTTTTGKGAKYAPAIRTISSNAGRGQYEVVIDDAIRAYGPASFNACGVFVDGLRTAFAYYEHPRDLCVCGYSRNLHEGRTAHIANGHDFELDSDCVHGVARSTPCNACTANNER